MVLHKKCKYPSDIAAALVFSMRLVSQMRFYLQLPMLLLSAAQINAGRQQHVKRGREQKRGM